VREREREIIVKRERERESSIESAHPRVARSVARCSLLFTGAAAAAALAWSFTSV
jgi:hypothetical protein